MDKERIYLYIYIYQGNDMKDREEGAKDEGYVTIVLI